jgi:PAS domain S-box-containing protein
VTQDTEAYRRLFESHPVAMAIWDPDTGGILAVNDAAVRQYGYGPDEARLLTIDRLVHPEDWPRLRERLATMPPGHVGGETFRHLRRDGSLIEVEMTGHELLLDGKPTRVVMALDVTSGGGSRNACARPSAWRPSDSWPAESPTTSTTC